MFLTAEMVKIIVFILLGIQWIFTLLLWQRSAEERNWFENIIMLLSTTLLVVGIMCMVLI